MVSQTAHTYIISTNQFRSLLTIYLFLFFPFFMAQTRSLETKPNQTKPVLVLVLVLPSNLLSHHSIFMLYIIPFGLFFLSRSFTNQRMKKSGTINNIIMVCFSWQEESKGSVIGCDGEVFYELHKPRYWRASI